MKVKKRTNLALKAVGKKQQISKELQLQIKGGGGYCPCTS